MRAILISGTGGGRMVEARLDGVEGGKDQSGVRAKQEGPRLGLRSAAAHLKDTVLDLAPQSPMFTV